VAARLLTASFSVMLKPQVAFYSPVMLPLLSMPWQN